MRIRLSHLILVVAVLCGHALSQSKGKSEMLDSFGQISNGDMRGRTDILLAELSRTTQMSGLIVLFGTPSEVSARKRYFQDHFGFRRFDSSRIKFHLGGNVSKLRTDFWIIPDGAEPPKVAPEARIEIEFGKATKRQADRFVDKYFKELSNFPNSQGYIVNYGSAKEIAQREKWITSAIVFRQSDRSRITLVRGGNMRPASTVMWIIPVGAANPPV